MRCDDCGRSMPDDSGCAYCTSADRALAPVVPIAPRLAVERPPKPETNHHPTSVPEGLREARRVLRAVTDKKRGKP